MRLGFGAVAYGLAGFLHLKCIYSAATLDDPRGLGPAMQYGRCARPLSSPHNTFALNLNLELGDYWMAVYRYDLQLGPITGGCLVSVERALYIYPIGEVTRLPFEWYCRCQKARLVHHTCKSATRALNDFRASWLL